MKIEQTEAVARMRQERTKAEARLRQERVEAVARLRQEQKEAVARVRQEKTEAVVRMRQERDDLLCRLQSREKELVRQGLELKSMRQEIKEGRKREEAMVEDLTQAEFERDAVQAQVKTPVGLAKLLQLSPKSCERVAAAAAGGVGRTQSSASPNPEQRNRFMERVVKCYTPIVEKLCSRPLFDGGTPRPERVVQQVMTKISQNRKGEATAGSRWRCQRKLVFNKFSKPATDRQAPDLFDTHLDGFLRDMAGSWRQARRNHERGRAATIVQIVLKTIPKKGYGRVSDWLGPRYFDEVLDIEPGSKIRVLSKGDHAKHRNDFEHSSLCT